MRFTRHPKSAVLGLERLGVGDYAKWDVNSSNAYVLIQAGSKSSACHSGGSSLWAWSYRSHELLP